MMHKPVVLIGVGEMGGVFARAMLKAGYPVVPVTRDMAMDTVAGEFPDPEMVILAVAEKDLHASLAAIPDVWRGRMLLLQNELLPRDWQQHGLAEPTVISVWFEKKKGMDAKVVIASPAYGPHAGLLQQALGGLDLPVRVVENEAALLFELVLKNLYILTTNIAGLEAGGNVSELWEKQRQLALDVATDVLDIQESLTGQTFDREALLDAMLQAFAGDPEHKCMGRTAPARLARALAIADEAGLTMPTLRRIAASIA